MMSLFREARDIGNNISNFFNLFIPLTHRENEFKEFCHQIYIEAEQKSEKTYNESSNFIEILLKNKNLLSSEEIQDEVSTLILSVS